MTGPSKLQKAGRAFVLRLVAEHGPIEAARILRALADELEVLAHEQAGDDPSHCA